MYLYRSSTMYYVQIIIKCFIHCRWSIEVVLLQWEGYEGKKRNKKKKDKRHPTLRCFISVQLLKLPLEGTNPLRYRDQIFCQLCQSTFFKMNASAGELSQLNESRTAVPTGCLLPAAAPSAADVWGGEEAEAVPPRLLISHLHSQISWQDEFDLDGAQTHFCWINTSTWRDVLQL